MEQKAVCLQYKNKKRQQAKVCEISYSMCHQEAETRAIYHMKKSKESSERLEAVTKETEQMTVKKNAVILFDSILRLFSINSFFVQKGLNVQIQKLQAEVEEFKSLADKRLHEKEALIAEKRFTEEQKDVKINSLSSKVNSLNDMVKQYFFVAYLY